MDDPADRPVKALFKKRTTKANLRKRPATPPPASSSSDTEYSSEDESGRRVKRRRKGGVAAGSSIVQRSNLKGSDQSTTKYAADRTTVIETSNDATRQSNWYEDQAPDAMSAKALLGKTRAKPTDAAANGGPGNEALSKGPAKYQNFIQKNPNTEKRQAGPMKAPTNVRTTTLMDYAADVCKDYKQTGFCGFGDSCKFLHSREDVKQGWALDRDWEISTKGKKMAGTVIASANRDAKEEEEEDEADAALLEKIPFACFICKESYKHPVVTKCGHYYCESCALQRYKKNPSCAACGAGTNGVFNVAKNLQKMLERKRSREERIKAKEKEEEGSDDEQ